MSDSDGSRLQVLFSAALELPEADRDAFLVRSCGDDAELLTRLRALVDADRHVADATARPIAVDLPAFLDRVLSGESLSGLRVGPYELRESLGKGGMGQVYRADRVDGVVEQAVAIKLLRRDLMDADGVRRFKQERRLLASFDHANIARLLDAAELPDGTPYVVMELIDGVPITRYCVDNALAPRDRVRLLRSVCAAVAEANQKLVVHRDIKPSNVLVNRDGIAKLLDFGIAQSIGALVDEHTVTSRRYFSPRYAAPEQWSGDPIGVSCDVYGLGLLLYEVLVGAAPFDFTGLSAAQIERLIRDVPPDPPSRVAAARGDHQLAALLRGDLDDIVQRCLRKAPSERYASAEQLGLDLDHYLQGRPVDARGGHAWYRLGKFVRRNRVTVGATALAVAALVVGLVVALWEAKIARQRADELAQVARFQSEMLKKVEPAKVGEQLRQRVSDRLQRALEAKGYDEAERGRRAAAAVSLWDAVAPSDVVADVIEDALLTPSESTLDETFVNQPLVAASLRDSIVERFIFLGRDAQAVPIARKVVATRERLQGGFHPETLSSMDLLAQALTNTGGAEEADTLWRTLLERRRLALGPDHTDTLRAETNVAMLDWNAGNFAKALPIYRDVLARRRRLLGPLAPDTLTSMDKLGVRLVMLGQLDEAEPLLVEAFDGRRKVLGEDRPGTLTSQQNLAKCWFHQGRFAKSEALLEDLLPRRRRVSGSEHYSTLDAATMLAAVYIEHGRYVDGSRVAEETMATALKVFGPVDQTTATVTMYAAQARFFLDHKAEALALLKERHEQMTAAGHEEDPTMESLILEHGRLYVLDGQPEHALEVLEPAAARLMGRFEANSPHDAAQLHTWLAQARIRLGRHADADRDLTLAWQQSADVQGLELGIRRDVAKARVELFQSWIAAAPGAVDPERLATAQRDLVAADRAVEQAAALAAARDQPAARAAGTP